MNRNHIASDILEIAILEMCRLKAGKVLLLLVSQVDLSATLAISYQRSMRQ